MKKIFRYIIPSVIIVIFTISQFIGEIEWKATDYLSFSMIILTYFYVVFTYEMLNRLETQSYLEKRPYLIADFTSERKIIKIYVKNIGKTPAKNVNVKITPDIKNHLDHSLNETVFRNKIDFFPPEKKLETVVHSFVEFFKRKSYQYQIELKYQDNFDKKYNETINVDLTHIEEQVDIVNKTINDIVKSIDKLTNVIKSAK